MVERIFMKKKFLCLILAAALVLLSGCGKAANQQGEMSGSEVTGTEVTSSETSGETSSEVAGESSKKEVEDSSTETIEESSTETSEPVTETKAYTFNPHLYLPILADDIPQEYWDALYNLCDAVRAGETTFECASEEAYKWATSPSTLTELFPPACTKILGVSDDGSVPFENGVGRIYYQMPIEEYLEREAEFEALIEEVLNTYLEADDTDYEKSMKLYDYITTFYYYNYDFQETLPDGAIYLAIMNHTGQCVELSSVYAYFLLQAGVQALQVGCGSSEMNHAWTYVIIDGVGYHSDPTWGLRSDQGWETLGFDFFLMTSEARAASGCPVDDLQAPLLPRYWAKFSEASFPAEDDRFMLPADSFFQSLDEENKVLHYTCNGEEYELHYGKTE